MKKIILIVIFFLSACGDTDDLVSQTLLSVTINPNTTNLGLGEDLVLDIEVKNADSLFALSLELNYSSILFEVESPAVIVGDIFHEGFKHEIILPGEVGVALGVGENETINSNGIACKISLTSIEEGDGLIYLSAISMIKLNGESIKGFDELVVEPLEIHVVGN